MRHKGHALSRAVGPVLEQLEQRRLLSNTLISGPASITAGSPYTINFNVPSQGSAGSWSVNWGDGSTPQTIAGTAASASHTYTGDVSAVKTISATLSNASNPFDTGFGSSGSAGKVQQTLGTVRDYAYDAKIIPVGDPNGNGGKILVAGKIGADATHEQAALLRFNADGTLDTTFGNQGSVVISTAGPAYSVAIQPDGNYLVAGGANFGVTRIDSTGNILTKFLGSANTALGSSSTAYDMALLPNGKIIVVGTNQTDFVVTRLNSDLSLDSTFATNGIRKTDINGDIDQAFAVAIDNSNRIVVVGEARKGTSVKDYDWAIARYLPDGTPDTSIGANGFRTLQINSAKDDIARDVAIQSNGDIVVVGSGTISNVDFAIARFTDNGNLDTSFNGTGYQTTSIGSGTDDAYSVSILPDGRYAVAGRTESSNAFDFGLAVYQSNGQLDTSFGSGGKLHTDFNGSSDYGEAIAVQDDGDVIVAGGSSTVGSNGATDFSMARYHMGATGTISFGGYQASFNFGPDGSAAIPGYITDIGNPYEMRSNGYVYGWQDQSSGIPTPDVAANFKRNSVSDQRLDTGIGTNYNGTPLSWNAAVPNGSYYVTLVAGDASITSGTYKYNIEGNSFLSGTAGTGNARWITARGIVVVTDGELTISNGSGASNHALAYVEITDNGGKNTTAVDSPTQVVATAASPTSVDVRWKDISDNEESYLVERSTSVGGSWTTIGTAFANAQLLTDTTAVAGQTYYYRVTAVKTSGRSASVAATAVTTPTSSAQGPYNATAAPWATGLPIQAEDFDRGGVNVAFHDSIIGNAGGYYRTSDLDVGYNFPNSRYFVGWTQAGEWAEYTTNVATTGNYIFEASVASAGLGGKFKVSVDGADKATDLRVPDTTDFTMYQTIASQPFSLTAGSGQVLRLTATNDDPTNYFVGDFDWLKVERFDAPSVEATSSSATQATLTLTNNTDDADNVEIYRRRASDTSWGNPIATVAASTLTYVDNGLTPGEDYVYRARSVRTASQQSVFTDYSAEVPLHSSAPTNGNSSYITIDPNPTYGSTAVFTVNAPNAPVNTTYTWSTLEKPQGASDPLIVGNGTGDAGAGRAEFDNVGNYVLRVTFSDGTTLDTPVIDVKPLLTSISVTSINSSVSAGATQQFTAVGNDQFGHALDVQPTFTWSVPSRNGTVDQTGLYTAANDSGSVTIEAESGGIAGDANTNLYGSNTIHLSVTQGPVSEVSLAWNDVSNSEAGYEIDMSNDGGQTYTAVTTTPQNATGWSVKNVLPNEESGYFSFRVRAVMADGSYTDQSNVVTTYPLNSLTWEPLDIIHTGPSTSTPAFVQFSTPTSSDYQYRVVYLGGANGLIRSTGDLITPPSFWGAEAEIQTTAGQTLYQGGRYFDAPSASSFEYTVKSTGGLVINLGTGYFQGLKIRFYDTYYSDNDLFYSPGVDWQLQREPVDPTDPNLQPTVSIAASDDQAWEEPRTDAQDNRLTYTVSRTGSTLYPLTVYLNPLCGTSTSADYDGAEPTSVTIPAGKTSTNVYVTAAQDNVTEPDETAVLSLKVGSNYRLGDDYFATGTIHDASNTGGTQSTVSVSGLSTSSVGGTYYLHLHPNGYATTSWSINWGDGTTTTDDGSQGFVSHVYQVLSDQVTISTTATLQNGGIVNADDKMISVVPFVPNVPASPELQAAPAANHQVLLTWTGVSDNTQNLFVEVSQDGQHFTTLSAVSASESGSYTTGNLFSDEAYFFRLSAVSSDGSTSYSNTTSVKTGDIDPTAPTGVTVGNSVWFVVLRWQPNFGVPLGEGQIENYKIESSVDGKPFATVVTLPAGRNSYILQGLQSNEPVDIRLTAIGHDGSNSVIVHAHTARIAPDAPQNVFKNYDGLTDRPIQPVVVTWQPGSPNSGSFYHVDDVWTHTGDPIAAYPAHFDVSTSSFTVTPPFGITGNAFAFDVAVKAEQYEQLGLVGATNGTAYWDEPFVESEVSSNEVAPQAPTNTSVQRINAHLTQVTATFPTYPPGSELHGGVVYIAKATDGSGDIAYSTNGTFTNLLPSTPYAFTILSYSARAAIETDVGSYIRPFGLSTPMQLAATGLTSTSIGLTWMAHGGADVLGIERSDNPSGDWKLIATGGWTTDGDTGITSYVDQGVPPGTWAYRLVINGTIDNPDGYSNVAMATTGGIVQAPLPTDPDDPDAPTDPYEPGDPVPPSTQPTTPVKAGPGYYKVSITGFDRGDVDEDSATVANADSTVTSPDYLKHNDMWVEADSPADAIRKAYGDQTLDLTIDGLGTNPEQFGQQGFLIVGPNTGDSSQTSFTADVYMDTDNIEGTVDWDDLHWSMQIQRESLDLTAYRTDGNFGVPVSKSDQESGNASNYAILTDTDVVDPISGDEVDNGYTQAPIQNNGIVPVGSDATPDQNLARIVLSGIPAGANQGTITLTVSDHNALRLFTSNGVELTTSDMTVDLSHPTGYLAGLANGSVNVWLEGIKSNPDVTVTLKYSGDSMPQIQDSIHINVIGITYVDGNGQSLNNGVNSEPEEDLLASANEYPAGADTSSFVDDFTNNLADDEFRVDLQGIKASSVSSLSENGQSFDLSDSPDGAMTSLELLDDEGSLDTSGASTIKQNTGATIVADSASIDLKTSKDNLFGFVQNNQVGSTDDFFFDGTANVPADGTNVWQMRLEDVGQGLQAQQHYLLGSTSPAFGTDVGGIVAIALNALRADVSNDPNRTIDIIGFSRGSAEAVDFANRIDADLATGAFKYKGANGSLITVTPDQLNIRFLGLYDLVTTINGVAGSSGSLTETLPKGVGRVAHAVALSEEREKFEFTDLSQLNPNGDVLDQLGFRGVHSDIGGGALGNDGNGNPLPDKLTAVTLQWMNHEAQLSGWTTLDDTKETVNKPATIQGLTAASYNGLRVHQIYSVLVPGTPPYTYDLQYRNFAAIDPTLQCWQPGINGIMPLYTSQQPQFWNPNYQVDILNNNPTSLQTENGA